MFNLSDLKKTRVYQEIEAEVEAKAQAEIAKIQETARQREKTAILRMVNLGISAEQIATFLDLPLAEVEATIAEAEQN